MKKAILLLLLAALLLPTKSALAVERTKINVHLSETRAGAKTDSFQLDRKALEQQLGRKLKLQEQALLWIAKKKINRKIGAQAIDNDERKTHPMALLGVACGLIPFLLAPGLVGVIALLTL